LTGRACNTRAQGIEILKRSSTATPVVDVLTYWVDIAGWFLEGIRPYGVTARGHGTVFRKAGFDVNDTTFAIITYENGAVVNLGVYYALPARAPQLGMGVRIEVYGSEGALISQAWNFRPHSSPHQRRGTGILATIGGPSQMNPGCGLIICHATAPAR